MAEKEKKKDSTSKETKALAETERATEAETAAKKKQAEDDAATASGKNKAEAEAEAERKTSADQTQIRNKKAMWIGIALLVVMGVLLLMGGFPLLLPAALASVVGPIAGFIMGFGGLGVFIALLSALMLPQGALAVMGLPQKAEFMGQVVKALIYAAFAFAFPYFVLPFIGGLILPLLGAGVPGIIMTIVGGLAHSGFYAGGSLLAYLGIVAISLKSFFELCTCLGFKTNIMPRLFSSLSPLLRQLFFGHSMTEGLQDRWYEIKPDSVLDQIINIGLGRGVEIVIGAALAALGIMVLISPLIGFALPFAVPLLGAILMTAIGSALALGLVTGFASFLPGKSAPPVPENKPGPALQGNFTGQEPGKKLEPEPEPGPGPGPGPGPAPEFASQHPSKAAAEAAAVQNVANKDPVPRGGS
jgi:hypothetical protein